MAQRQTCAVSREVSARKGPTPPMTNRDGVGFHSDCIPLPPTCSQVSAASVRPARWCGPELPGVFRADPAPPDPILCVYAGHRPATQSTGDRQNSAVSIPLLGIRRGPPTTFPQVIPEGAGPCQGPVTSDLGGLRPRRTRRDVRRGQGSGGARPRSGRRALRSAPGSTNNVGGEDSSGAGP